MSEANSIAIARPRAFPFVSVSSKLAGATVALLSVVTVCVYLQLSRYQRENLLAAKEAAAAAVTRLFSDSCAAPVIFEDSAAIEDALTTLGRNEDVEYAAVWSSEGTGDRPGRRLGELRRGAAEPVTELPSKMVLSRRADRVVLASPVVDGEGKRVAVAIVAFSLARENQAIAQVRRTTLVVSAGVGLGLLLLLLVMARLVIVGPLGKLVVAAKQIEEGRPGEGFIDLHTSDEVGQLARGFRSMATAIRVREEHIEQRNTDMRLVLDNVGQGFVTLDLDARLSAERSRIIDTWFGAPAGSPTFAEYLKTVNAGVGDWFAVGWAAVQEDLLPLDLCLDQLPKLVRRAGNTFELAYRPIFQAATQRLDKVIVVITDVTTRIERERAEQTQREMMSIFRRMLADRRELDELVAELTSLVDGVVASDGSDMALLRRQLHTLKGNCAIAGIESVGELCHVLEDRLEEAPGPLSPEDRAGLRGAWTKFQEMYAKLHGTQRRRGIEIEADEYQAFVADLQSRTDRGTLVKTAASWAFDEASGRLVALGEQFRELARRMGKAEIAVEVICLPRRLRLPPRRWAPLWTELAHVVRNTVDHGIETTEERIAAGKRDRAAITLSMVAGERQIVFTVEDDGGGIDWQRIAAKAEELGLPHQTPTDLEEALFAQGVSSRSATTSTSGRGVGLGAVRAAVRELGGELTIRSARGRGTTLRFMLPASMLEGEVSAADPAGTEHRLVTATGISADNAQPRASVAT